MKTEEKWLMSRDNGAFELSPQAMTLHDWSVLIIQYDAGLDIRNLGQLPRGTGCRYLEVVPDIEPRGGMAHQVYRARAWRRKPKPKTIVIEFK